MKDTYKEFLAIIAANVIFGLNTPVTKSLIEHWMTPVGYTLTRMLFGTLMFWTISLFSQKEKESKRDMLIMAVGGLCGFVGTQLFFALALQYTTPVYYSLIISLTPVLVLLISVLFLKEHVVFRKIIGVVISVLGAVLIILQSRNGATGSDNQLGISIAFMGAFSYSLYLIITKGVSVKYSSVTVVKWMFLFSAIIVLPFGFLELPQQKVYSSEANTVAYLELAFALLFSTTIAFFLMPFALRRLKASTVSIFMNLQPITASTVAIVVGQDIFTWDKVLAGTLVIGGVYLVTRSKS